uniref:DNA topoisomerase 2 n=1 Tax=Arcella intermedia TaxID=1963864 RepID=A0A6B2KWU8_9EUKA
MSTLRVEIDREAGWISVFNDGRGIPVEKHKKEQVWVPELIFGHLLTSSNFDDSVGKVTGGRNGFGAKLCNIFSQQFIIETGDERNKLLYRQVFEENMSVIHPPEIGPYDGSEGYTLVKFRPDFKKFGQVGFDEDTLSLFARRVYDMAGCVDNVKVFLNGTHIDLNGFKEYIQLYLPPPNAPDPCPVIYERVDDNWEVCCTLSDGQFQQISFVNGICTSKGGTHVNHVVEQIIKAIQTKEKYKDLKPLHIKNHLLVFINCLVENPSFDSQTKENMTSRLKSGCTLSKEFIRNVVNCGLMERVKEWIDVRDKKTLKKTDGSKRSKVMGIRNFDDAAKAGGKESAQCTLILTEGDSAKSLAVSGLGVIGRDYFGIYALRGKLLNVRRATSKHIAASAEIGHIKQILGLQIGKKYDSVKSLRYGRLMLMTDQDVDGSHIKGLIMNFLDYFWPSLLALPGFLVEFVTPIVKATRGKEELSFFTIPEYEKWKDETENGKGWYIKYYKGLGTSTADDAKKYFKNMDQHIKTFQPITEQERELMKMVFGKEGADERKQWIADSPSLFLDHRKDTFTIGDFLNKELVLFSAYDNGRSIPSMWDGLKTGQRKIMFSCFKRKLKSEIKVMQLAGYVSEHAAYHHGEASLTSTIVGLAQDFCGSNNINLLLPNGQFGTRLDGGRDAASPRYIFTALSPLTRLIYRPEDDELLEYLSDDGQSIEPKYYLPIIPMILVNGTEGIGTGWATSFPNYNPLDLCNNIKRLMENMPMEPLYPWYLGFKGVIRRKTENDEVNLPEIDNGYVSCGIWQANEHHLTIEITELPVRKWTQSYKEFLDQSIEKGSLGIKEYQEYHTDRDVKFVITFDSLEDLEKILKKGVEKELKLEKILNNNLVCIDLSGKIKRYEIEEMMKEWYEVRLQYYQKRKRVLLERSKIELRILEDRIRFVKEVIQDSLIMKGRKKGDIVRDLEGKGYFKVNLDENGSGFDYLLSMPMFTMTEEKILQLEEEKMEKEGFVQNLMDQLPITMWRKDLEEFEIAWKKLLLEKEKDDTQPKQKTKKDKKSKKLDINKIL